MPMASAVTINPTFRSLAFKTSLPYSNRSIWNSAPKNQKYEMPATVRVSGRSRSKWRVPVITSEKGLRRNRPVAPEAGTRVIRRLHRNPASDTAIMTRPIFQG